VRKEIEWALDAGARTIPIWHNGFRYDETIDYGPGLAEFLSQCDYKYEDGSPESAITELLNYFGVTPS
jgi:hypothetical protein